MCECPHKYAKKLHVATSARVEERRSSRVYAKSWNELRASVCANKWRSNHESWWNQQDVSDRPPSLFWLQPHTSRCLDLEVELVKTVLVEHLWGPILVIKICSFECSFAIFLAKLITKIFKGAFKGVFKGANVCTRIGPKKHRSINLRAKSNPIKWKACVFNGGFRDGVRMTNHKRILAKVYKGRKYISCIYLK